MCHSHRVVRRRGRHTSRLVHSRRECFHSRCELRPPPPPPLWLEWRDVVPGRWGSGKAGGGVARRQSRPRLPTYAAIHSRGPLTMSSPSTRCTRSALTDYRRDGGHTCRRRRGLGRRWCLLGITLWLGRLPGLVAVVLAGHVALHRPTRVLLRPIQANHLITLHSWRHGSASVQPKRRTLVVAAAAATVTADADAAAATTAAITVACRVATATSTTAAAAAAAAAAGGAAASAPRWQEATKGRLHPLCGGGTKGTTRAARGRRARGGGRRA